MRIVPVIIICLSFSYACRNSAEPVTYPEDKLVGVMADLYITGEILDDVNPALRDSLEQVYRKDIEEIHGIDLEKMQWQIERIQKEPETYRDIHEKVKDSLAVLEKHIRNSDYKPARKPE